MDTESIEIETETEQPDEVKAESGSKPKQKRAKNRSPKLQLQVCADELSELASQDGVKSNNRVDALIRKADILTELARLTAKEKESEALAANETLKQEIAAANTRVAALEAECANWEQKASERVVQTVPDPRLPETLALNLQQADLIQNTAQAILESVEEPTRFRIAASLCKRMGRGAQPMVSEIADFASIFMASQRGDDELQDVISQAAPGARGSAVQVAKATLSVRNISVIGPRSSKPTYADVFDQVDNGTF